VLRAPIPEGWERRPAREGPKAVEGPLIGGFMESPTDFFRREFVMKFILARARAIPDAMTTTAFSLAFDALDAIEKGLAERRKS